MSENNNVLYVRMLGGFSMDFDGRRLQENFRENSQVALLLQTILHYRNTGVDRNLLIRTLFGDQELDNVSHSLRSSLYVAKKKLRELGLPDIEYFRRENNTIFWTDEIDVIEDAEEFEQSFFRAMQVSDQEDRLLMMIATARLYTGEFLPQTEDTVWIPKEAERLRGFFHRCMWEISFLSTQQRQYVELYETGVYASSVDPYACWEALALKALVGMDQYEEAELLYNSTLKKYIGKFGSRTAKTVRDLELEFGKYMMFQHEGIAAIQDRLALRDEQTRGGFYCSFPVFQGLYRSVERVMIRFGGFIFLMLCTLVDKDGKPIPTGDRLEELSEKLRETLIRSVRHSDTITRYSKGQFLVLLFGTSEENCSIVTDRIEADFAEYGEEDAYITFSISKVIADGPGSFPFFENVAHKKE